MTDSSVASRVFLPIIGMCNKRSHVPTYIQSGMVVCGAKVVKRDLTWNGWGQMY